MHYDNYAIKEDPPTRPRLPEGCTIIKGQVHVLAGDTEAMARAEQYEEALTAYKQGILDWKMRRQQLMEQFKIKALKDVGLTNHPKADRAYALAWDRHSSDGLREVHAFLCELSDLIL